jgi:hypothetical protein
MKFVSQNKDCNAKKIEEAVMRRITVFVSSVVCFLAIAGLCLASGTRSTGRALPAGALLVSDFYSDQLVNALGGAYGAWEKDPSDPTQKCTLTFAKPGADGTGKAVRLEYSVDSPNPAYNGFWMKLQDKDISKYKKLVFWAKGNTGADAPNNFKVELKNSKEAGHFYVTGITSEWTKVEIPFDKFEGLTNLQKMTEFTIVFEDQNTVPKKSSLYIGEIYCAK